MFRFNKTLQRFLTKYRNEQAKLRLIQLLMLGIYLMHIFSCFWNLNAKIYGDMEDPKQQASTWIARRGETDSSVGHLYILGLYWALQTITTVGYGDFGSGNSGELFITTMWMCIGVAFYSFTVGAVTSTIVSQTSSVDDLESKLKALDDFKRQIQLDE